MEKLDHHVFFHVFFMVFHLESYITQLAIYHQYPEKSKLIRLSGTPIRYILCIYIYIIIQDLTNKKNHNSFDIAPVSRIDATRSEDLSRTQLSAGLHGANGVLAWVSRGIFSPEIGGNHV